MESLRLYVYVREGEARAITLAGIAAAGNLVKETDEEGNLLRERPLETEAEVCEAVPGGNWHEITLIEAFLGEHDERVEALLMEPIAGGFKRNATDIGYYAALCEVAVRHWTLPYPRGAAGIRAMRPALARFIGALVDARCNPPLNRGQDFTTPLTLKSAGSSDKGN